MAEAVDVRGVAKARRMELGAFLKSRRARIAPRDVGFPVEARRRTPGLRREEVAQLSGIGVTWYTWLEQGREINVSVQVLNAVARTLSLNAAEKAHLYRLADVPTVPPVYSGTVLPGELQVILDHLEPLPGVVLSARYDVLAHNRSYEALCPVVLSGERNLARRVFLTPECFKLYRHNWDDMRRMVGYLRGAYANNLGDPGWEKFIAELHSGSASFASLWALNDVAVPVVRTKRVRNLAVGELEMFVTSMSFPSVPHSWMQVYTPVDEVEWGKLRKLLAINQEERQRPGSSIGRRITTTPAEFRDLRGATSEGSSNL
ncbi:helix-turn-helix domain-containing protein [Nocardia amamiensis]|uniref:Helix-turn-helix domain-containing protein n=1 Tax=Nocardia amamiensis TaxID=404578 RepID=A0ABS0D253_9NOCA|nr:helix-turn-helix transcriptional regulator [Nocardia amamiensis]MBF6302917.1 helix-turn-helix domain-containing protein [Nocardia amamiensis]